MTERQLRNFWAKVDKSGECWLWTASTNNKGYGKFGLNRKTALPHRISYELSKGSIPQGTEIDHECRVRTCVRPEHLVAKTHLENAPKGSDHYNAKKTHCSNGHEFNGVNTRLRNGKWRTCRACERNK